MGYEGIEKNANELAREAFASNFLILEPFFDLSRSNEESEKTRERSGSLGKLQRSKGRQRIYARILLLEV